MLSATDRRQACFPFYRRESAVVAFVRKGDDDKILVLCNLSRFHSKL
jgi:hypothetical protein